MNKVLKGSAASRGNATGKVRVIKDESEFSKFDAGEILVARQTSPAWTPLFAAAKAVITELGGITSHAAIVAREYGIPAIVAVKDATKILKNGQIVKIDGLNGIIEVEE